MRQKALKRNQTSLLLLFTLKMIQFIDCENLRMLQELIGTSNVVAIVFHIDNERSNMFLTRIERLPEYYMAGLTYVKVNMRLHPVSSYLKCCQ